MPPPPRRQQSRPRRSKQTERFRVIQRALRISHIEIARLLGASERTIQEWSRDAVKAPPVVMAWLEACYANRRAHPEPPPPTEAEWRRSIKWQARPTDQQPLRWRATTTKRTQPLPPKPKLAEIIAAQFGEDLTAEELLKRLARDRRRSRL